MSPPCPWPLAAWLRYPDVTDVWFFDHVGRLDGDYQALTKPAWYYLKALPGVIAPWTIVAPIGLWLTRRAALTGRYSPERFLWCWAIATGWNLVHGRCACGNTRNRWV